MFIFIIKEDSKCFRHYPPLPCLHPQLLRDGPLENLWGGGGGAKYKKIYSRKRKLNEKTNHARQLMLKNIHTLA